MKKRVEINGETVRREREKRAWTQEELSERSQLGVRTLRRLEAGQASLDTIKRVTQALAQEPAVVLPAEPAPASIHKVWQENLPVDLLILELSSSLVSLVDELMVRIVSIRRHLAHDKGFMLPGVRLRDNGDMPPNTYRILLRERPAGRGEVVLRRLLACGQGEALQSLSGPRTHDPTYAMPGVWIEPAQRAEAEKLGCLVFDPVSVIATHLTDRIKANAARLLGVDEVHQMLEMLHRPQLVAELIPGRLSLVTLRTVLRNLLEEGVSIRDLGLILEKLADCATLQHTPADLTELVRSALAERICSEVAQGNGRIGAILIDPGWESRLEDNWDSEHQALRKRLALELENPRDQYTPIVTSAALRRRVRELFPSQVILSRQEIVAGFQLQPVVTLGPK